MNIEELKNLFDEKDLSFEDVEKIIDSKNFSEAAKLGVDYAKSQKFVNFEDAPFCIDKIDAVPIQIVIADSVKKLIDDMKKSAIVQSDTAEKKGDNYEASFCLYGQKKGEKIIITGGFWDERGYKPNEYLYADPDSLNYGSFFDYSSNTTTTSTWYDKQVKKICESATADNSLVVIYGHTHPQTKKLGKINNYPSRTDIVLSVEEAVKNYSQPNGNCTFLNAIVNADGDLNIFGYSAKNGKFAIFDDVKYQNGEKIASYTEENYTISPGTSGYGL